MERAVSMISLFFVAQNWRSVGNIEPFKGGCGEGCWGSVFMRESPTNNLHMKSLRKFENVPHLHVLWEGC
jgi:hypothetical protein